jgi:lactate dehydrogenase-like 2-hydroxyacid dehydrogenase
MSNLADGGKYSNLVAFYRHNSSADRIGIFDAELINALPPSCKWIAHNGAGYDQIDIAACQKRGTHLSFLSRIIAHQVTPRFTGIKVSNTPGAVDEGTATTALYLLLSSLRQFSIAERNLRSLQWKTGLIPAHDPSAVTLGILGMGGIGTHFATMAHALPVKKILYYNRTPKKDAPAWAEYVSSMDELLEKSDVLSVHCPLNEHTVGLVGEKQIMKLKRGSIIINTARGKVIDEAALIKAIEDGHVSSMNPR